MNAVKGFSNFVENAENLEYIYLSTLGVHRPSVPANLWTF